MRTKHMLRRALALAIVCLTLASVTIALTGTSAMAAGTNCKTLYLSGGWLGAGENFGATTWANTFSTYCAPRWGINAWGNVVSYSRNCN